MLLISLKSIARKSLTGMLSVALAICPGSAALAQDATPAAADKAEMFCKRMPTGWTGCLNPGSRLGMLVDIRVRSAVVTVTAQVFHGRCNLGGAKRWEGTLKLALDAGPGSRYRFNKGLTRVLPSDAGNPDCIEIFFGECKDEADKERPCDEVLSFFALKPPGGGL